MTSPEYQAPTWVNEDDPAFIEGVSPDLGAGYLNALSGAVEDHGQRLGAITPVVTYLNDNAVTQDAGDNRYILQTVAGTFAQAEATTTALAGKQPLDADLTALAGLDSTTAGTVASDGAGWVKKTYAQLKTALGLATIATSGKLADATDVTTSGAAVDELLTVSAVSPFGVTTKSLDELIDTTPITASDLGAATKMVYREVTRSSGDVAISSTGFVPLDATGALDLLVPAAAGDVIEVIRNAQATNEAMAIEWGIRILDASNVNALREFLSLPAWSIRGGQYFGSSAVHSFAVGAGDIVSGAVKLRLLVRLGDPGTRTVFGSTGTAVFKWWAKNYGPTA